MACGRHDETERKYDVAADVALPDISRLDGVGAVGSPVERHLDATYFDTEALDLARHGARFAAAPAARTRDGT